MSCGIYKIENLINGKVYIGQSTKIEERWKRHLNSTLDYPLYRSFKKYGIENFSFEIVEECSNEELNEKEKYWVDIFDSYVPNGYNQAQCGSYKSVPKKLSVRDANEIKSELQKKNGKNYSELSNEYGVSETTISRINIGEIWYDPSLSYPLSEKRNKISISKELLEQKLKDGSFLSVAEELGIGIGSLKRICVNHGLSTDASFYNKTKEKKPRQSARPPKEQLEKDIKELNFVQVGRKYGVSDNAVRKWCKFYGMSPKARDYK